jgi:type IV pilus assembly protein PilW
VPTYFAYTGAKPFLMTNVDGTADAGPADTTPNNWRNYRYRVYERVIPLRNLLWGTYG